MPKSRAISLKIWTWVRLKMIIFLSFREVGQSVRHSKKKDGQNIAVRLTILYWPCFFECRSSSAAHDCYSVPFLPAHDGGHSRQGSQSHRGQSHQSPRGLSGGISAALGCYNITSNHIRRESVYTSAALL